MLYLGIEAAVRGVSQRHDQAIAYLNIDKVGEIINRVLRPFRGIVEGSGGVERWRSGPDGVAESR